MVESTLPQGITNITNSPFGFPDWSNIAALFEYYKVCGTKVKWVPGNTNAQANALPSNVPVYIIHDWNNINETFTQAYMVAHETMTVKYSTRPWTYYRRTKTTQPPYMQIEGSFRGYVRSSTPIPTNVVRVWNTDSAATLGTLIVTLYIAARYRK